MYRWVKAPNDPWLVLAAWRRAYPATVFSGLSAAWMHGLDCSPITPTEVIAPTQGATRSCDGLSVRRCDLAHGDVVRLRGLSATSLQRTLRDICVQTSGVESLVLVDMSLRLALADRAQLSRYADESIALPGSRRLRLLVELAEPAESPMESRLRWLLHRDDMPKPQVQTELRDGEGRFLGRADLYYPGARLVVEFDGANHRERLVSDDRRQNLLVSAGYKLLRFTSADLRERPTALVAQVRAALDSERLVPNVRKGPRNSVRLIPNTPFGDAA